jgi:hypothetical protein
MPRLYLRRPDAPVYREVLSHAFHAAWEQPRYWLLAFFSALLLTAGSYDVVLKAFTNVRDLSIYIKLGGIPDATPLKLAFSTALSGFDNLMRVAVSLQVVIAVAAILIALAALSCICQGGLVFALGALKRGGRPTLAEALRVGGGAFWPVAALNALVLTTLWILRFLAAFPLFLALEQPTASNWFLYLLSFLVFIAISFVISIVQIFALNAMILQGASVQEAIVRGYAVFKKHWMVAIETAVLLFFIALGLGILCLGLFFVFALPMFAMVIAAGVLQSRILLTAAMGLSFAGFFVGLFAVAAFVTQFQYATWTFLYRKLGEGGVLPKLHRLARAIAGTYGVPQR